MCVYNPQLHHTLMKANISSYNPPKSLTSSKWNLLCFLSKLIKLWVKAQLTSMCWHSWAPSWNVQVANESRSRGWQNPVLLDRTWVLGLPVSPLAACPSTAASSQTDPCQSFGTKKEYWIWTIRTVLLYKNNKSWACIAIYCTEVLSSATNEPNY